MIEPSASDPTVLSAKFACAPRAAGCCMNPMIDEPLERLRAAARRTRELALKRAGTGLGHEDADADDDVGTIGTDGALGFDPFPLLEALHRHGVRSVVIGQVAGIMHGSAELTGDLDLLWGGEPVHAPALAAAFMSVDARLSDETGTPMATHPDALLRPKVQFTAPGASGDCCTPALPWGDLRLTGSARGTRSRTASTPATRTRCAAVWRASSPASRPEQAGRGHLRALGWCDRWEKALRM